MALRVLCIDDDVRLYELLAGYLEPNGVTLVHAADGPKGLAALGADVFDAVLLDVMMPGMDGLDVCRRIRETSRVPIIMLTARGDEADRVVGLELGADDYVPKPFSPRELLARLRAVLRRAQPAATGAEIVVGRVAIDVAARQVRVGARARRADRSGVRHPGGAGAAAGPGGPARDVARRGRAPGRDGERPDRRRPRLAPAPQAGRRSRTPRLIKTVRGVGYVLSPEAARDAGGVP